MATATSSPRTHRPGHPRSRRLALDPYRVDDMTFTREEILRARGMLPAKRRRRSAVSIAA
jgi:hypothetical protein